MPHFEQQPMECHLENSHGPKKSLSSLQEKSREVLELKDHSKPCWGGLSFNPGLSAQFFSWLGAAWNLCLCHTCVEIDGPPQPMSPWSCWGKDSPCGWSSNPSLMHSLWGHREHMRRHALSHHITPFYFLLFYTFFSHLRSPPPLLALGWWPHWENFLNDLIFAPVSLSASGPYVHYPLFPSFSLSAIPRLPSCCQGSVHPAPNTSPSTHVWDCSPCHFF